MDYKEEQIQELDALNAIYPDELSIDFEEFPEIKFHLRIGNPPGENSDSESESENRESASSEKIDLSCSLEVEFPENYPEVLPEFTVVGLEAKLPQDRLALVNEFIQEIAEENLGMALVFTVYSALQEHLTNLAEQLEQERQDAIERKKIEEEEREARRLVGTPVTLEAFLAWKEKFDQERTALRQKSEKEAAASNRLTGRQQFLKDATLNLSDLKLLDEADQSIKIDESLFEDLDDLELGDED